MWDCECGRQDYFLRVWAHEGAFLLFALPRQRQHLFCVMAELVYHYRHRMKEKRILELGAGLGLTSLCVAKAVPAHVVISDYSFSTLANIRYNIELNVFHEGSHVEEAQLDWCTVTSEHVQELNPDIILAADTVYDLSVIPAFCDTLKLFVGKPLVMAMLLAGDAAVTAIAWIMCSVVSALQPTLIATMSRRKRRRNRLTGPRLQSFW